MFDSRPFQALCCLTQAQVLQFCLTPRDLRALGAWKDEWRSGFTPHVWSRGQLQRRAAADPALAQRISDALDLEHLDVIAHVRAAPADQVGRLAQAWIEDPFGPALPSLLWALVSDLREDVHPMGLRLGHEATARATSRFVAAPRPRPSASGAAGSDPAALGGADSSPPQTRTSPSTDSSDA